MNRPEIWPAMLSATCMTSQCKPAHRRQAIDSENLRRNKTLLASGGAIAATLIVGLGLATWMYVRAATERARGEAVSDFLQLVLASSNASEVEEVVAGLARGIGVYDEHAAEFKGPPAAEAELATSYAWLANFLATTDRQQEAKAVISKAAEHFAQAEKRGLPATARLKALWYLAIAQLRLRDEAGYREACAQMLLIPSENDDDQHLRLWIWCLGPHPGEDLGVELRQAEQLAANHAAQNYVDSHSARWIDLGLQGGLLYRAGQYEQAAQRLDESLAAYPDDALGDFRTPLDGQLLLAMTKWQLGQRDEARRLLAETQLAIDEWLQKPSNTWMRRAEIELLRREVEGMIEPPDAHEAVDNTGQIRDGPQRSSPLRATS